ncbi:MAG: M14 family metallocarboxypeptidase [Chloroflexi bacterium]|nr:succinylglutamate desuccinylase/aspartoacylase family protein [Chloroflexota bacterium]MYB15422.1 M14 family metallocarboxypeptidase [Chloroflexota bacterium]
MRPQSYAQLMPRYEQLGTLPGVRIDRFRVPDRSHQILGISVGPAEGAEMSVGLSAGAHGDEPAPVQATLQFLEEERWRAWPNVKMRILPCLNPTGFDLRTRENDKGQDVNRTFKWGNSPESLAAMVLIGLERVDLWIDAHEDPVEDGFYCFSRLPEDWGPPLVAAVGAEGPIYPRPEVDEMTVREGIVQFDADRQSERRRRMRESGSWGLSGHIDAQISDKSVTLETPGVIELETRIRMQLAAYSALLDLATKR